MRRYRTDILEVYGGQAEISAQALRAGLRVLQPVDKVYGIPLDYKTDFAKLQDMIMQHRPYLLVYEIPCTAWSSIQRLNYKPHELQALQATQTTAIRQMVETILKAARDYGGHFLLENPAHTDFWKQPDVLRLHELPDVQLRVGCMCRFGLKDKHGKLVKKPTAWMSGLPLILDQVALPCLCDGGTHGEVMGGSSQISQVYTTELAQAVIRGLCESLEAEGDERFQANYVNHDIAGHDLCHDVGEFSVFFLDVNRHEDSWLPLLQEVDQQLQGKVRPDKVIPLNTPFGEQLKALVPWQLQRIQVCRTPVQRRLPLDVLQAGAQHRGAALWLSDGSVKVEAEAVTTILSQSANKFASPVRAAIFFFGTAPETSLNKEENA